MELEKIIYFSARDELRGVFLFGNTVIAQEILLVSVDLINVIVHIFVL